MVKEFLEFCHTPISYYPSVSFYWGGGGKVAFCCERYFTGIEIQRELNLYGRGVFFKSRLLFFIHNVCVFNW